jgi:gliding-associated putative ABC transporter substrate-binding component GldG
MEALKKLFNKIKSSKISEKSDGYLTALIILGLIAVINVIAAQIFFRIDLTASGDYSISKVSKKAVAKLDDVVNIRTYFSKNVPAKYLILEQEVSDIIEEYANYSNGKIKIKAIDPSSLADAQNELAAKGIPALQFNVLRNDSFQTIQGYLGVEIEYGGKAQTIPVIGDTQNLEYQITSAIKKLAGKNLPVIGIVTSNGALKVSDVSKTGENTISQAYAKLADLYKIEFIDLSKEEISSEISTLLIAGPKEKFTEDELKKIDAFVMRGKALIIMADGVNIAKSLGAVKNELDWEKLLSAYGLKLNNNLISDTSNGRASFSSNGGAYTMTYMVNYPFWPKILPNNMDKANVIVANLQSLIFPWASSVEAEPREGLEISYLVKTTGDARAEAEDFVIDPKAAGNSGQAGQYNLAVLVSGRLSSAFGAGSTDKAKIVLVGDSDFATDMFSGAGSDNMLFFQNIADGLTLDSDLINIRAKSVSERPIKSLGKVPKELVRYANIFGITALILIFGLARYFLRRRNKGKKERKEESSAPVLSN